MSEPKNKYFLIRKTILGEDWLNINIELLTNEENLSPIEIRRRLLIGINKITAEILNDLLQEFI